LIVVTDCQDHEMLKKISTVSRFIEEEWPGFSRLADYVFIGDRPPVGWNFKKCGCHGVLGHVALRRGIRGVWSRWKWNGSGNLLSYKTLLDVVVHEICHIYDARHGGGESFMKNCERHGKFLAEMDGHANRVADCAWKRFKVAHGDAITEENKADLERRRVLYKEVQREFEEAMKQHTEGIKSGAV